MGDLEVVAPQDYPRNCSLIFGGTMEARQRFDDVESESPLRPNVGGCSLALRN